MVNKKFENKETGEVIKITNDDDIWYTLNNGAKIRKDSFFNKYSEVVDPFSFFNNSDNMKTLAEKITKIDSSTVENTSDESGMPSGESLLKPDTSSIEDKKRALLENYKKNQLTGQQTNEPVSDVLKDNPNYPEYNQKSNKSTVNDYYSENLPSRQPNNNSIQQKPIQPIEQKPIENETFKFFRNFKKNHDIEINLKFNEKIADPEFLRLMSNNFEADVVEFYSNEIFNIILSNPSKVKYEIYNQLNDIINGKKSINKKSPKKVITKTEKKIDKTEKDIDYPIDKMVKKHGTDDLYAFIAGNGRQVWVTIEKAKEKNYKPKLK